MSKIKGSPARQILGLNIALYRKIRGISLAQLAKGLNTSYTHMRRIENGDISTGVDYIYEIAKHLDVSMPALFNDPLDK